LLVLAVALVLVFGVAHLLGRGGSSGGGPSAQPVGADQSPSTSSSDSSSPSPSGSPSASAGGRPGVVVTPTPTGPGGTAPATPTTPLAQPTGSCASSDVVAVPSVDPPAYAARPVVLRLTLTTRTSPACSWEVSPSSLVLKITSGPDRVWSTQDCRNAVHKQVVTVRKDAPTTVSVVWNGQRSDAECSHSTSWALPGYYHAVAAAFGADPMDVQFRLVKPVPATVTASPTPSGSPSGSASAKPSGGASAKPSGGASTKPSAKASGTPSRRSSSSPSAARPARPSGSPAASTSPPRR
jgi:hypothetical protein